FTVTPPAVAKPPPAYRASPDPSSHTASAETSPFTPVPDGPESGDHALPSHFATRFTVTPPAVAKPPPAYNASPDPSSHTASAETSPFTPVPDGPESADPAPPPRSADRFTVTPPAVSNHPPAYKASPPPSSHTASA